MEWEEVGVVAVSGVLRDDARASKIGSFNWVV